MSIAPLLIIASWPSLLAFEHVSCCLLPILLLVFVRNVSPVERADTSLDNQLMLHPHRGAWCPEWKSAYLSAYPNVYADACVCAAAGLPCPCSLPAGYDVTQSNLASEYIVLPPLISLLGQKFIFLLAESSLSGSSHVTQLGIGGLVVSQHTSEPVCCLPHHHS